jgi:hypothetical protein
VTAPAQEKLSPGEQNHRDGPLTPLPTMGFDMNLSRILLTNPIPQFTLMVPLESAGLQI